MSLNKEMENIIQDVFGNDFNVRVYSDACYIEFLHNGNPASIAIGIITYPGSIELHEKCAIYKRFNEVESILQPILDKYKINIGFWKSTIYKPFEIGHQEFNRTDFEAVRNVFEKIKLESLTHKANFLDQYKELHQVYESSEKMEVKEMVGFISQPLPLRRMVIKKLCGDSGFESFCNQYIESSEKKAKAKPSQFKGYDKAAKDLFNTLIIT
ncbi:hypothetical protein AB9P05_14975 [Roseivirga sp. BDSF3-8]|uniref:hypothetical protein n=1 Tax=Roseivirga sp. BDSF3-8 TaxID=3241598 RepID=UPI003531D477